MSTQAGAAGIYSDDFSGATFPDTAPGYTKVNETGGATIAQEGFGTADARAVFTLPSGTAYEMWGAQGGLCLQQTLTNNDFTVTAKLDTIPTVNGQEAGIYFINNATPTRGHLVSIFRDSGALSAFEGDFILTSPSSNPAGASGYTAPVWIRAAYTASTGNFAMSWSDTGAFAGEQITANRDPDFTPSHAGIYAGSFSSGGIIPAWVAKFDYFFESTAVISPEDPVSSTRRVFVIT